MPGRTLRTLGLALLTIAALAPRPVSAQKVAQRFAGAQPLPPSVAERPLMARPSSTPAIRSVPAMTAAGLFTGAAGGVVSGMAGLLTASTMTGDEWAGLTWTAAAIVAGTGLGAPVGVHFLNGRRGSFPLELLAGAGAAGIALGLGASGASAGVVVGTALVGSSVAAAVIESADIAPPRRERPRVSAGQ